MKDLTRLNPADLKCQLFADRGTDVAEAMKYAYKLIETLPKADRAAAYTALHVVLNTVANAMEGEACTG
jgi:hypothetical protein